MRLQVPEDRLGCHPQTGFADIQSHPFFRSIDWELLERKQITPPYKPSVKSDRDLEHFDPQFTSEPVTLTPDDRLVHCPLSYPVSYYGRRTSAGF